MTHTCTVCGSEHWVSDAAEQCAKKDKAAWRDYYVNLRYDSVKALKRSDAPRLKLVKRYKSKREL